MKKISIIIPVFNEAENIQVVANALHNTLNSIDYLYEIIFVNDGSSDNSVEILKELSSKDDKIFYINFSRNFGHQNALKAGADISKSDAIITMDGDMQHPPELIPEMLKLWEDGNEIVYTRRIEDKELSYFKKKTSSSFYKIMNSLSEIKFEPGTADFRLMDKKVVQVFCNFTENELFIRGLVNWLGFKQAAIDYMPQKRNAGKSKYNLKKMMKFAVQGITSFSTRPLYLAIYLGIGFSFLAFIIYLIYILYSMKFGHVISGWSSVLATVVFFGGLNLIMLGIIGIYIGKLFIQSKNRPNYIISETNYK